MRRLFARSILCASTLVSLGAFAAQPSLPPVPAGGHLLTWGGITYKSNCTKMDPNTQLAIPNAAPEFRVENYSQEIDVCSAQGLRLSPHNVSSVVSIFQLSKASHPAATLG